MSWLIICGIVAFYLGSSFIIGIEHKPSSIKEGKVCVKWAQR